MTPRRTPGCFCCQQRVSFRAKNRQNPAVLHCLTVLHCRCNRSHTQMLQECLVYDLQLLQLVELLCQSRSENLQCHLFLAR